MRMRLGWLVLTAAAYGVYGGWLLYQHLWDANSGLAWTSIAWDRLLWAAGVFLLSTRSLARRHPAAPAGWLALHAAGAFVAGAALAWCEVEYWMTRSEHPWDTDVDNLFMYCLDCVPRRPIIRQTVIATLIGSIAAAGLAPLVARVARRGGRRRAEPI